MMPFLHLVAAVLASWRLTELVVHDRLTAPLRTRWPGYLWTCPRCVSVWAGMAVTALYVWWPWGNWPLALAWLYLVHRLGSGTATGRVARPSSSVDQQNR
jgi:hypothetical protein